MESVAGLTTSPSEQSTNHLLLRLPRDDQRRLMALCTPVRLRKMERLCDAGGALAWAHFPLRGLVSLQSMTEDGDTVEVMMIGREGMIGLPLATASLPAPSVVIVQIAGDALRVRADLLQAEFERSPALQRVLVQHWHALLAGIAQGSVCHRFHTVSQRLCCWLLAASDRTRNATLEITQEHLGRVLGNPRTCVTTVAVELQDLGVIRYRRGRITILDRRRLERMACECYQLSRTRISI